MLATVNRHLKMTQDRHAKVTHQNYGKRAKTPENVNR
jgi:hypothetical protein